MDVQKCAGGFEIAELPKDPQAEMISRCRRFQQRIGKWNTKIRDYGKERYCLPKQTLHHLDMALQECSEAWDLVEGGWKHHKVVPKEPDDAELLMELVDVAHFVFNAYLYMGGQPESELVAAAVGRSNEQIRLPYLDLEMAWRMGERLWSNGGAQIERQFGHGQGAHGLEWEKGAATRINHLRAKVGSVSDTIRHGLGQMDKIGANAKKTRQLFPPASGFIYVEIVPWMYCAVQAIPHVDMETFFSAFIHKNDINFARQDEGY